MVVKVGIGRVPMRGDFRPPSLPGAMAPIAKRSLSPLLPATTRYPDHYHPPPLHR